MAFGSLIDRIVGFDREKEKQRELDFQRGMQPIYQKAAQRARAQYSAGKIPIQERDSRINRIVQENSPQAKLNWFDRANLRAANTVSENKILRPTLVGLAQLSPTKTLGNFTGYAGRAGSALGWDKGKYLAQAGDNIARYTQPDFQGNFASRGLGDSIVSGGIELLSDISNPVSMTLAPFKYGTQTANELARGMESTGRFSPAQSFAAGTGLGAVSAILERTGLDKITGGAGTRAVRRIATSGAVEGLTEGAQQLTSNIATNRLVDRNQGILQGVPQSLAAGAILGSGIKGGIEATAPKGLNDAQLQERYKWMNIYTKASDKGKTASMEFAARKIDEIDKQGASPLDKAISKVVKPVDAFDDSKYIDPLESLKQEARKYKSAEEFVQKNPEAAKQLNTDYQNRLTQSREISKNFVKSLDQARKQLDSPSDPYYFSIDGGKKATITRIQDLRRYGGDIMVDIQVMNGQKPGNRRLFNDEVFQLVPQGKIRQTKSPVGMVDNYVQDPNMEKLFKSIPDELKSGTIYPGTLENNSRLNKLVVERQLDENINQIKKGQVSELSSKRTNRGLDSGVRTDIPASTRSIDSSIPNRMDNQKLSSVTELYNQATQSQPPKSPPTVEKKPATVNNIKLYHGSNSKFDKFDSAKYGTGEGADLYGKGAYLTDNKDLADFYAKTVSKKGFIDRYTMDGPLGTENPVYKPNADKLAAKKAVVNEFISDNLNIYDVSTQRVDDGLVRAIAKDLEGRGMTKADAIAEVQRKLDYARKNGDNINGYRGELDYLIKQIPYTGELVSTELKKRGYDGLSYKSDAAYEGAGGNNYVIYNPDKLRTNTPIKKPTLQDALESKTAKIDKLETTTKLDGRIVSASENKNLSDNIRRQLKDVNSVRKQIIDAEVEPLVELGKTSKNIINQIKAQGGISTSAYESIPKSVMNKQGMSADKMAQVLGYADEDMLVEAIQSYSKPLSRAELRQRAIENLESGKSEYSADWKQTTDKANELLAEIQTLPIVRKKVKVIDNEPHIPSKEEIDSLLGTYKRTSIDKSDEGLQIVNEEINAESGTVKSKTVTQTSQPEVKDKIEGDFTESSNKYLGSLLNSETQARLYADKLPKLSKEKRIDAIKAIDAGKKTGDKEIDDYVKEFKKYTDNLYAKYKSQGVNMGYVDSYLPRIYKHPETGAPLTSQEFELLQLGSSRQKKRIAGELEAESLLYDKPEDLLAHYVKSMERTVAGKQYLSSLEKGGYITASSQRPKGLKLIDAEGFAEEGGLNLYAKPEIADALNRIFGSQSENKLLRGTARVASVAQDLGLSGGIPGTPANAFTIAQLTKEVLAGNIKGPAIALAKSFKRSSASKYFKENADTIAEMQKSGIALSTEYNMTSLRELAGDISDQDGKAAKAWDRVMSDPTFRRFMPILQVEMYKTVKQHKNASVASQAVKNFYGLTDLVTQRTRSKNTNNAATALLFAPKYRESMVRFWVKNVQALNPKGAFKNARSGEYSQNLKFVAGATVLFGAMQALNYALNGVPTWDNPDGKKDKLLIPGAPGVGGKTLGLPFLSSIATVPRNAGMAVYNAVTQNPDELKKNVKSFSSYLGRPFWDLMDNENYFGQRIVDDKASTAKRATQGASYLVESFQHPYVRESLNLAKNKLPESVQEFVGARDTTPLQSLSQALESPVRFYDPKYFKGGKNQPVKGQEDQRLQKKPNGKFTVTIGGEEKTFDSQEKAKKALSIDDFKNGTDKVKEIDGKMYLKADNEQGYTTKSKSEYQFDKDMQGVDVAMDKAKESGDLKTWLTQAEKKYNALLKKRNSYDPETEFDKIDTINKQLLNIEQSYSKYAGYGGFKKGGSGKGRKKKYSFDVPSSFSLLPKTSSIGSVSNLLKNARVDYRA